MPSGAGTSSIARLSLRDAGNESGTFKIYAADVSAGNYVAQLAKFVALVDAAMALVLGAKARTSYANQVDFDWDQPTNGAARELALLIQYKDATTGQRFTAKLPTLDPEAVTYVINVNAKDVVLMDEPAPIATFVTAFNAMAINPYTGNACEVIGLKVSRGGK